MPPESELVVITSGAAITVNKAAGDTLPPGLVTTIEATLGPAMRAAGTVALSAVELPKVVVSAVEFHETCDPETKFAPVTASVNVALPAGTVVGEMALIVGAAATTVNATMLESVPPGLTTCTLTGPGVAIRLAGTVVVSVVLLTNVVAKVVPRNEI